MLAGDLDATPAAASIRFLRGLQSLDGISAYYHDAWERTHPDVAGHTFAVRNPLMTEESDVREETSRRIDYVFVRCDDRGPTLGVRSCALIFDAPVDGVWPATTSGSSPTWTRSTAAAEPTRKRRGPRRCRGPRVLAPRVEGPT